MESKTNGDSKMASQLWHQSRMHGSVALRAEADEILFRIFTLAAPTLNVMDLEPGNRPPVLTSPAISLQEGTEVGKTKRGKGTKWMALVDGQGLPLGG